ncbi:MAG: S8 family serine peptidase [Nanoarchaeota archaeon]
MPKTGTRNSRSGQVTNFLIFGIFVLIAISILIWMNPYSSSNPATQNKNLDVKLTNPQDFQSIVNSFQTSVETCLRQYSREGLYLCKKDNPKSCRTYIKNYLKLRGADCFQEPSYQGMTVTANPPFMIDFTETLERINIKVSINTIVSQGNFEAIIDSYTFSVLKEGDDPAVIPSEMFDIDGQEASLAPPPQPDKTTPYSADQAIISYKMPPGQALQDAISALPLKKKEKMFNSSQLKLAQLDDEARILLSGLLYDDIITFDTTKIDFETIHKKLSAFEEVKNVTRNAKDYSSHHMKLPLLRDMMRGRGAVGPNDPFFRFQWYLQNRGQFAGTPGADISMINAWNITHGSPNVTIAVIDEGIYSNPDISLNIIRDKSYNFLANNRNTNPMMRSDTHGTHVAGVIVSQVGNGRGIAGICPKCKIINMLVLSGEDGTDSRTIMNAVLLAVGNGAKIVTMSLGGTYKSDYEEYIFKTLSDRGIIFLAAAGNDGTVEKNYPAAYTGVIAVGATDNTDRIASFSNYGDWVNIYAPGDLIVSDCGTSSYCFKSGTSMATPMVAGVVGLMKSLRPDMVPEEALSLLQESADDNGEGIHRLNAEKTLKAIIESR